MMERLRQRIVELLPWYDQEDATRRDQHTEGIRQRAIRSRIRSEQTLSRVEAVRRSYLEASGRMRPR